MKIRIAACLGLMLTFYVGQLMAQEISSLYLKNGTVVKGTINSTDKGTFLVESPDHWQEIKNSEVSRIKYDDGSIENLDVNRPDNNVTEVQPVKSLSDNEQTSPAVYAKPVLSQNGYVEVKPKSSISAVKRKMNETIVSAGLNLPGSHESSSVLTVAGYTLKATASNDTDSSYQIAVENISYIISKEWGIGLGAGYQFAGKMKDYDGNFSFIPVYGAIKFRSFFNNNTNNNFYTIGRLGYNLFSGDNDYKGSGNMTGGLFYGAGIGLNINPVVIELAYSVNKGSVDQSGTYVEYYNQQYYYYPYDLKTDVTYSKFGISLGYMF